MTAHHGPPSCNALVTGDVVLDHYIYQGRERRAGSKMLLGTIDRATPGGAALLYELLRAVASKQAGFSVSCGLDIGKVVASAPNGYCVMRPFPKRSKGTDEVWRMAEPLGFGAGNADLDLAAVDDQVLAEDHRIVVLDDAGVWFRRWPARSAWPRFLLDSTRSVPEWLVIKMSGPVASGDLWHSLVVGATQDVPVQSVRHGGDVLSRTIAVIPINDLRVEPIYVSKDLSWERSALDLVQELCESPRLAGLRRLRFVVVSLDTDGALIAEFPQEGDPQFRLVFDPARLEGDFVRDFDANGRGELFGYQSCLTAALVSRLARTSGSGVDAITSLERGVINGLCTKRRFLVEGHGPVTDSHGDSPPAFPHESLANEVVADHHDWPYGTVNVPRRPRSDRWTIIAGGTHGGTAGPLWGLAQRVARRGLQQLRQTPYLHLGKLFSIERTEIESLRTLHRLLISYRDDRNANKPLSIAAFGPPGSGKSFGVTQLAKAILGEDVPLLTFNLSQFEEPKELRGLLHQVRDRVLLGRLPVVFWDEFDCQDLRWLQYLLAPMQDGSFQEGPITHPIGKCVFVFAGGTSWRFEDFGKPPTALQRPGTAPDQQSVDRIRKQREQWKVQFRAKKGPDFKSRLAGYINVVGPNRRDDHDITFPVRRALLLRVHLGLGPEQRLIIDRGLLAAFLEIEGYRHGARSMEKIAEQVRLASRTGAFARSDLPSRSQLELHVNAERFLAHAESET